MTSASLVYVVITLSDGRIASAGNSPYRITFWNLTNETSIFSNANHTGAIYGLIQLQNTTTVVSASFDKTIMFWNSLDGILIKTIQTTRQLGGIGAISGSLFVVGTMGIPCPVQVWNFDNNTLTISMSGHPGSINTLIMLPNGLLATGASDGTVKLWNVNNYTLITTLSPVNVNITKVYRICWLNNGLLAAASDNNILLWDISTRTVVKTLANHTDKVFSVIQLKNGLIASGSADKSIKLWDANTGSLLNTLKYHTDSVWSLAETSTGQIVSGSVDKKIAIWKS